MSIRRVERAEAASRAVRTLGLDDTSVDLASAEGISSSLRRAASLLCPAPPSRIVDAVIEVLRPLLADTELKRDEVAEVLDSVVSSGDLLELRHPESSTRLLYLGPPSYVEKEPGNYLLLGVRPFAEPLLDEAALGAEIECEGHTRSLFLDRQQAPDILEASGLHRMTREQWSNTPRSDAADVVIAQVVEHLAASHRPGRVEGLVVIDSARPVRYYKGRWRELVVGDNGIFVGRRPQAYGSPIWCVVEVGNGLPQAVIDLPMTTTTMPGWDEARRLQAALDAVGGTPQVFRVDRESGFSKARIDFFAPLPSWAERYLTLSGMPVTTARGALFSYRLPQAAVDEAMVFLSKSLWMTAIEEEQGV